MKPVNNHILIEPVKHESFLAGKDTYDEIGIVIDFADGINWIGDSTVVPLIKKGDKVFFDSWLAAKYPDGKDGYLWLVKWEDVRATENG